MSKKKYKIGIESIKKQISIHKNIKLEKATEEGNVELAQYYEKEIKRLEEQLLEKQNKLLPRSKKIKFKIKNLPNFSSKHYLISLFLVYTYSTALHFPQHLLSWMPLQLLQISD